MPDLAHAAVVVVADDPTYPVGSSEWNADHSTLLADTDTLAQTHRLVIHGADRLTAAGSSEVQVLERVLSQLGSYIIGTVSVLTDQFYLQYKRAILQGTARATVSGTGELYLFDLAPVGRLVLAGRGG